MANRQRNSKQANLNPSLYLKREQDEYVRRLQATHDSGDWEGWLSFFLDAVAEAAEEASKTAIALVELRQNHQALIPQKFGKRTTVALQLLHQLYNTPIVTAKFVESALHISQPSASSLLNESEATGLLTEVSGKPRYKKYAYSQYLQLFPGSDERA